MLKTLDATFDGKVLRPDKPISIEPNSNTTKIDRRKNRDRKMTEYADCTFLDKLVDAKGDNIRCQYNKQHHSGN